MNIRFRYEGNNQWVDTWYEDDDTPDPVELAAAKRRHPSLGELLEAKVDEVDSMWGQLEERYG